VFPLETVVQAETDGSAGAVRAVEDACKGFVGDIVILPADAPMISAAVLRKALACRRSARRPAVVVVGTQLEDPAGYGRLIFGDDNNLKAVVEHRECLPSQLGINVCNAGPMIFDSTVLWPLLKLITNENSSKEYYLTDIVYFALNIGLRCAVSLHTTPLLSANTPSELALVNSFMDGQSLSAWGA